MGRPLRTRGAHWQSFCSSAHRTPRCSRPLAQLPWGVKDHGCWRSGEITRTPPLVDTSLPVCLPHQVTGSQTGKRKRQGWRKPPASLHQGHRPAPASEAVLQPRHIERGCPTKGLFRLRLCKAQEPALGVRDECQIRRLHHPRQSHTDVGQAATQCPAGQAQRVKRGTREQAEAGVRLLLSRPGLALGPGSLSLGLCACARPAAAGSLGAAEVPAAARRVGVWAIHGQQRGPR